MTVDSAAVRRHQKRVHFLQQDCFCGSPGRAGLVFDAEDLGRADMGSSVVPWSGCRVS